MSNRSALAAIAGARETDLNRACRAALLLGEHEHPVGQIDRLFQIVRDHDHGHILLAPDAGQFLLHGHLGHGVEGAQRLIKKQYFGLYGKGTGDA